MEDLRIVTRLDDLEKRGRHDGCIALAEVAPAMRRVHALFPTHALFPALTPNVCIMHVSMRTVG